MMRQLGGSFGIAILTTMIHIKSGIVRTALITNLNEYNNPAVMRKQALIQGFMGKGKTLYDATQMANQAP